MTKKISTIEELLNLPDVEDLAEVYTIPELGTFKIRPMNQQEYSEISTDSRHDGKWDEARWECLLLSTCIVEPKMTYDQAMKLRAKRAGPVSDLCMLCGRISGLTDKGEISKEAVDAAEASFRQEPDQV